MITRRSAQIILVVLWVLPSAATTQRSVFSQPSIEYMMVCLQAVLAVLHPLAYMLRHAPAECALQSSAIAGKLAPSAT